MVHYRLFFNINGVFVVFFHSEKILLVKKTFRSKFIISNGRNEYFSLKLASFFHSIVYF